MATTAPSSDPTAAGNQAGDLSPDSVDSRVQELIERAMALSERNDLPAAVLSCRQAIALAPESSQGYSMLGLLLERAGDNTGAITAYEKVLQLAPDSLLERDSLARLRASAGPRRTTRGSFVFDDKDLSDDEHPEQLPTAPGVVAPNAAPSTQAAIAADAAAASAVAMSMTNAPSTNASGASASHASRAGVPFPSTMPTATSGTRLPQVAPAHLDWPAKLPTLTEKLRQHPSFYFRGVPLALTAILSLGILSWAHNHASSRSSAGIPPAVNSPDVTSTVMNPDNDSVANANANPGAPDPGNPGSPTGNPTNSATPATTIAGTSAATKSGAQTSSPGATAPRAATPPAPTRSANSGVPSSPRTPAPAPPRNTAAPNNRGNSGNYPAMPPPRLGASGTPDDTVRIVPSTGASSGDGGAASSGGAPVNPGGARDQGYVRVSPGGAARPPVRPENAPDGDEISGGDAAFRYQQRAGVHLQSGDYDSAINDYQAAIAAYNDMIARGERVSFAQSGVRASQRGIQIAQARR